MQRLRRVVSFQSLTSHVAARNFLNKWRWHYDSLTHFTLDGKMGVGPAGKQNGNENVVRKWRGVITVKNSYAIVLCVTREDKLNYYADVWRLSVAYIGPKSRTERPGKNKIGTEVAHVTHDSDTTFNVKRSKVNLQRGGGILWRPPAQRVWFLSICCSRCDFKNIVRPTY